MLPKPFAASTLSTPVLEPASVGLEPGDFDAVAKALGARGYASDLEQRLASRFARPVRARAFTDRTTTVAAALKALGVRPGGVCVVSALADLETHLDREVQALTACAEEPDAAEGIAAFREKRRPCFCA